jgi:hypothetical protein
MAKLDGIQWVIDSLEADDIRHLEIILQALPSVKLADFFQRRLPLAMIAKVSSSIEQSVPLADQNKLWVSLATGFAAWTLIT